MEAKSKSKRKKHPEAFKREAVRLLEGRGERTVADVSAGLGVAETLLHAWKKKYGSATPPQLNTMGWSEVLLRFQAIQAEATTMRRLGMSLRAIGAALGVDEKTVRKALAGLAS